MKTSLQPVVRAVRRQHPVGQGGLHSCDVSVDNIAFTFVYDCGSSNRDELRREVTRVRNDCMIEDIDLLVISHLDDDHVCGLDDLLAQHPVGTVVLPYLSPLERISVVAECAARGPLTPTIINALIEPSDWLSNRGCGRIVWALPARPDTSAETLALPDHDFPWRGVRDTDVRHEWRFVGIDDADDATVKAHPTLPPDAKIVRPGTGIVADAGIVSAWDFLFYRKPVEEDALRAFRDAVWAVLKLRSDGRGRWKRRLLEILSDRVLRRELAALYALVDRHRNSTTLCMFDGPRGPVSRVPPDERSQWALHPPSDKTACLLTGDYPLRSNATRRPFESFFEKVLGRVRTFAVPHHGSRHNFDPRHLRALDPHDWLIAAGRNSYGHPHPDLVRRLGLVGRGRCRHVSHEPETEFVEELWG